jgi:hypothetical protein
MAEVALFDDVGLLQIAQGFEAPQFGLVVVNLSPVSRELY